MKVRLAAFLVLLVSCLLAAWLLPLERVLGEFHSWVELNPGRAFLAVGGLFIVSVLLMLPSSPMMMLAGFTLGIGQGFVAIWLAGFVASALAFNLSRSLARPWMQRKLDRKPYFIAIERAVHERGLFVVLLTRMVLVLPFPAMNYTFGLTRISCMKFVLGTSAGMIPTMLFFVYLGSAFSNLPALVEGDLKLDGAKVIPGVLLACLAMAALYLVVRLAKKALQNELEKTALVQSRGK